LTDLDAIAGWIADEKARETFSGAAGFDGDTVLAYPGFCGRDVSDQKANMAFAGRTLVILDTDVNLKRANLKPRTAARLQLLGLFNLGKP
jgi:hypothetical protein